MHELAVCEALIAEVAQVARAQGARRVVSIRIAVGPLSGVEPALLRHAYPVAAAGSIAAHATLEIETVGIVVRCRLCGVHSNASSNRLLCGGCGTWQVEVVAGEELTLQRVEVERDAAPAEPAARLAAATGDEHVS